MKLVLLSGFAGALSLAVPAGAGADTIYVTERTVVQIVPADPYGVAVVPPAPTYGYNAYAYAPGYDANAYAPGYRYASGYRYAPGYATERRYVAQQKPSLVLAEQPADGMVQQRYAVERRTVYVVERPARRVAARREIVRTVAVPVYPALAVPTYRTAVPAYRNPVYDQDIYGQYIRPISCAIDAYGIERCN